MKRLIITIAVLTASSICWADLTPEQKVADFNQLAALYAKNYGPYEWKRDVMGFDALALKPWLDKISATKTDVDFWDLCVKYVASLQDSHDEYTIPSTYDAWLHFDADLYDGKVLIDGIDRAYLSRVDYPFTTGDELISLDGRPVAELIKEFGPYSVNGSGNPLSRDRLAVGTITERYQPWNPRAASIPEKSTIVVKRADGTIESYTIAWDVVGTPVTTAGIVPSPRSANRLGANLDRDRPRKSATAERPYVAHGGESDATQTRTEAWGLAQADALTADAPEAVPDYMEPLAALGRMDALKGEGRAGGLSPFGRLTPVFNPPASFRLRLGSRSTDLFLSGTFTVGANTIGFIRIPTFSPSSTTLALQQFATEMAFFQQNTSALLIDVMANGGGSICYSQSIASLIQTNDFYASNLYLRATAGWLSSFASALRNAKSQGAPGWVIALYGAYVNDLQNALKGNRALTGALPICGTSATASPTAGGYTKPVFVVTDNYTLSAAELFSAFLQDSGRATFIGMRTDGGGGNVVSIGNATVYSEGATRMTQSYVVRGRTVQTPGFPAANTLENTGVYPDILLDYMTADNLATGGTDFFAKVSKAIGDALSKP